MDNTHAEPNTASLPPTKTKRAKRVKPEVEEGPAPFTASDLAGICHVDLKTIHNWVDRKEIPPEAVYKTPGRHLRFRPILTTAWLTRQGFTVSSEKREALGAVPTPAAPFVAQALIEVEAMATANPASASIKSVLTLLRRAEETDPTIATEVDHLRGGTAG